MADEKFDEKDMEKRDEKSSDEKSGDEKWRRDPLSAVIWAAILIWAGLALLAGNLGLLESWQNRFSDTPGLQFLARIEVWSLIFLGAAIILLVEVLVRLTVPTYRRPVGGLIFLALIFLAISLEPVFGWNILWPLILIGLGLSVLLRGMFRRPM